MDLDIDPGAWPDGSEEFAQHLTAWLDTNHPIIDALVNSRNAHDDATVHRLMELPAVVSLLEAWNLWEEWSELADADGDLPLLPHLGEPTMLKLWWALWGARAYPLPEGGYEYVV